MKPFLKLSFLICFLLPVLWGILLSWEIVSFRGIALSEIYQILILVFLYPMLSYGSTAALFGFFLSLFEKKKLPQGSGKPNENSWAELSETKVAIVMPVYEEDERSTFPRIEAMYDSLRSFGQFPNIQFFILSDTRTPEKWIREEFAYLSLCESKKDFSTFHYRRRKQNLNGKSGNIADFCRRWGKQFEYMLVLDADSYVSGNSILRMIQRMESQKNLGILQAPTQVFQASTLFQKMMSFSSQVFSPLFLKGTSLWQTGSASYWGHNAMIRIDAFMKYCALPPLPNYGGLGGKIMSHDTIEATLMKKAGYEIICDLNLSESYEESPPNFIDSLKRDQRWCKGNLQHIWFLFAPGIPWEYRLQIGVGILAYLGSPLWGIYMGLSFWNYWQDQTFFSFSMLPEEWEAFRVQLYDPLYTKLLLLTLVMLFLPRVLVFFQVFCQKGFSAIIAFLWETLHSILTAPIYMVYHSIFVFSTLFNKKVSWGSQNRSGSYSFSFISQSFGGLTLLGVTTAYISYSAGNGLFWITLPIWLGWVLSIPLVAFTSTKNRFLSYFYDKVNKGLPQEEVEVLNQLLKTKSKQPYDGHELFFALVHPRYSEVHIQLQGKKVVQKKIQNRNVLNLNTILYKGTDQISDRELLRILSDERAVREFRRMFWSGDPQEFANEWKSKWKLLNPFFEPSASNKMSSALHPQ